MPAIQWKIVAGTTALYLLLLCPLLAYISLYWYWESNHMYHLGGDEPDYLIISHSLVQDGDLAVGDDYRAVDPPFEVPEGPVYSIHSIGLPIYLAPGFAYGDEYGAKMMLVAWNAMLPVVAFFLLNRYLRSRWWSAAVVLLVYLGMPFLPASNQIFPDLPSGVLILFLVERWVAARREGMSWGSCCAVAFALALLPWLHAKNLAPQLVLLVGYLWVFLNAPTVSHRRTLFYLVLGVCASTWVLLGYYHAIAYGSVLGVRSHHDVGNSLSTAWMVASGLHWGSEHGIFLMQPLFLLGLFGVPMFLRRDPMGALMVGSVYGSVIGLNVLHPNYYGGYTIVGRFSWSVASLWLIPLSYPLRELISRGRRWWLGGLISVLVVYQAYLAPNWWRTNWHEQGLLSGHGGLFRPMVSSVLPAFRWPPLEWGDPSNWGAWGLTALILLLGDLWSRTQGGRACDDGSEPWVALSRS